MKRFLLPVLLLIVSFSTFTLARYGPRPWRTIEDVELATLSWVHRHNTTRLHRYLDDAPPSGAVSADATGTGSGSGGRPPDRITPDPTLPAVTEDPKKLKPRTTTRLLMIFSLL